MWECWNCGFQNVDAAPVCAKCRARKPNEGEDPKGRSFHSMQQAAKERVADEVPAGSVACGTEGRLAGYRGKPRKHPH